GNFGSYNKTYGSLGAVIGFMTWIWISSMVILGGAEIDAIMERLDRGSGVDGPIRHAKPDRHTHTHEVPHTRAVPYSGGATMTGRRTTTVSETTGAGSSITTGGAVRYSYE